MLRTNHPVVLITLAAAAAGCTQAPDVTSSMQEIKEPGSKLIRHDHGIANEYIVVLKDEPELGANLDTTIGRLASLHSATIGHRYEAALRGFAAKMTEADALALADDHEVEFVEQNAVALLHAVNQYPTPSWGLDRIDQASLPLNNNYLQLGQGQGATIYVIDTGINSSHTEFAGRLLAGASIVNDGRGTEDCNGHGTHVAGIAAGTTYGVAKRASIVPVRIMDCQGSATTDSMVELGRGQPSRVGGRKHERGLARRICGGRHRGPQRGRQRRCHGGVRGQHERQRL
jgi:hypothetical protein